VTRSGDALAMCHRLCGLSTYGLKAHIREMITPRKLTIGHSQPLPFTINIVDTLKSLSNFLTSPGHLKCTMNSIALPIQILHS